MNRKTLTMIVTIALVAVVTALVYLFFQNRPTPAEDTDLTFVTTPNEVEVTIDGEDYGSIASGETLTVPLREEADIEVSREGFIPDIGTAQVNPGVGHQITVELRPESDEAEAVLDEEETFRTEQEATEEFLTEAQRLHDESPILDELPQHGEYYSAYQGLPETAGYDWAIHLHLYEGYQDEGREAFYEWLTANEHEPEDYDIVERIEDEAPPAIVPDFPSWSELRESTPEDVEITEAETNGDLTVGELAQQFAEVSTTWDAATDIHHTEGLMRATPLMTPELAETIDLPHRPTTSPNWRDAAQHEARSVAWVSYYEEEETEGSTEVIMDICWSWVTESDHVVVDGPRTIDLRIDDTQEGPLISDLSYEDPDPFVDNTDTSCRPDDAPAP